MNGLMLLLTAVVVCPYRIMGNPLHGSLPAEHFDIAASAPVGLRTLPHLVAREAESPNSVDEASLCYFVQESEIESQISCRLRFPRSKFNFNPFGLRFGKRDRGTAARGRSAIPVPSALLPYLLKLKQSGLST
ncbi:kisspeptin 2 isoform X2 [Amia ocellicauda]